MIPENRTPTHPSIILKEEFLEPLGLSEVALAKHLGLSIQCMYEIVCGKQSITPQIAWLLAQAFGTTPQFWLNLQMNYDLAINRPTAQVSLLPALA